MWTAASIIYVVGAGVGFLLTDARPATRLLLGLLWPLGPAAFVVTASGLFLASLVAFPAFGMTVAALGAATWWWWGW